MSSLNYQNSDPTFWQTSPLVDSPELGCHPVNHCRSTRNTNLLSEFKMRFYRIVITDLYRHVSPAFSSVIAVCLSLAHQAVAILL